MGVVSQENILAAANISRSCFVCFDALCPSQQFFSHVGTFLGINQYRAENKVS